MANRQEVDLRSGEGHGMPLNAESEGAIVVILERAKAQQWALYVCYENDD
jgi:hypothetical protein